MAAGSISKGPVWFVSWNLHLDAESHGMRRLLIIALAMLALAGSARTADDDGYQIRIKVLGVGETMTVEKDESQTENVQYQDVMGKGLLDRASGTGEVSSYRETIMVKDGNKPAARIKRSYDRAMKREGGDLTPLAYDGRTVLIERKKDRYHFWLDGRGELTAAEAKLLDREFNNADERFGLRHLLPAARVRAGAYPWPVDMAPLVKDLARTGKLSPNALQCRGTGQLKRVWRDDDNHLMGEFFFQLELPMSAVRLGKERVPLRPGAKGVSQLTLELCIDGSIFYLANKDTMKIEAVGPHPAPDGSPGQVAITVQSNTKGKSVEIPGK